MQQSSIKFASDEFVAWVSAEFAEPVSVIEECGGAWECFEFGDAPGVAMMVVERSGGLITSLRIQRFGQRNCVDTGALHGFGSRYASGGVSAKIEAQREEFLSSMRRNLSYQPAQKRAA